MKRTFLLIVAVSAVVVMTAGATSSATPGVTAKSILLEGTFPLSGPASGYAPIPAGMGAYFSYVNAHGGVNGRQLTVQTLDDAYVGGNAVKNAVKLINSYNPFTMLGISGTSTVQLMMTVTTPQRIPTIGAATGARFMRYPYDPYVLNL